MKWFVMLAVIFGAYYWLLISSANMMIDQTMQLHQQYVRVAEQADQIAVGKQ